MSYFNIKEKHWWSKRKQYFMRKIPWSLQKCRNSGHQNKKIDQEGCGKCDIYKKNRWSKSKPSVVISRANHFNSVVAMNLNEFGKVNVLWRVWAFTRMIKGIVLKDTFAEKVIKGLHGWWCINFEYTAVGSYWDNGRELKNFKIEELRNYLGFNVEFGPSFLPWSNGINERNRYNADKAASKIMGEDKTLQEAVI